MSTTVATMSPAEVLSSSELEVDSDWERAFTGPAFAPIKVVHSCDKIGCGETFDSKEGLEIHRISHESPPENDKKPPVERQRTYGNLVLKLDVPMMPRPKSPVLFVCNDCEKVFPDRKSLGHHKRSHSKERPFECPEPGCGCAFKKRDHLLRHQESHRTNPEELVRLKEVEPPDSDGLFSCDREGCGKKFSERKKLNLHVKTHSDARPFKCPEEGCGRAYKKREHLKRHQDSAHRKKGEDEEEEEEEETRFSCPSCPSDFASRQALKKHTRKAHPPTQQQQQQQTSSSSSSNRHPCPECGMTFPKRGHLSAHLAREHDGQLPHACPECPARFAFPNKLRLHRLKRHTSRACSEEGCGEQFRTFGELRRHLADKHPKVKKCPRCGREFARPCNYERHMLTHLGEEEGKEGQNVFKCPHEGCDRVYLDYKNLQNHGRVSHQGLSHRCQEKGCGRAFASRRGLAGHMDEHKGLRKPKKAPKKGGDRARRKDRGKKKAAMAAVLTGAEVDPREERELVREGATAPLDVERVEEDVNYDSDLRESFVREEEEADRDKTGAELCAKEHSAAAAAGLSWKERWIEEEVFSSN